MNRATVACLVVLVAGSGCAFGFAIGRDGVAFRLEAFDVRVGTKESSVGGVRSVADKRPMSDNALAFGEKVAPLVAEAAAKGAAKGAADAIGIGALGAVCEIPGALLSEDESEEESLTPEEREVRRERREKRLRSWREAVENETPRERELRLLKRAEIEARWGRVIEEEERLREEEGGASP